METGSKGNRPPSGAPSSRLVAVLGPTNTGKTYLAIERMLGYASGMIGFPLRLLARENYDRVARQVGAGKVALVTGEERIVPPNPSYYVCTVESMPLEKPVRFLAIDEIQMAADPERGHFFTDRLLHARGMDETMLLGADTVRPILQRLEPKAEYVARPRFSTLSYTGPKKITRLPPRSAVVGFSASEVYGIAELIRRQRGGAAVVMGALSPRTRNAQVAMFQNGEVDYIVATDAIGMGLNMDVNHVAFASLRKFDGRTLRPLAAAELGQIAGRAGRHMNDGTFGTTSEAGPLDAALVEQIENHRFDPLKMLMWRNTDLDFASVGRLLDSLNAVPLLPGLQRAREADDLLALMALAQHGDIVDRAGAPARVRLLWDVCQVPDFRKTMSEEHTHLLEQLFRHLSGPQERLPADWVDRQVKRLERFDGDIDTLMSRIAHTRTWTYISHRSGWLDDAASWQERARALEDRLSDALHERLMQRFVDRRTALLVRRLKDQEDFMASVADNGEVHAEGEFLGRIEGFRFVPDTAASHGDQRAVMSAALRVLRQDMPTRLQRFGEAPDAEFEVTPDLRVAWRGGAVARLLPSGDILAPRVEVLPSDLLDGPAREIVRKRTSDWLSALVARHLGELLAGRESDIGSAARGVMFQLAEHLGVMAREQAEAQLSALDDPSRKALARLGVRVGIYTLYVPTMLKPAAIRVRAMLWAVARSLPQIPALPAEGRTSIDMADRRDTDFLAAIGYLPLGGLAIRADMVERLAAAARRAVRDSRETHEARRRAERDAAQHQQQAAEEAAAAPISEPMSAAQAEAGAVTQEDGAIGATGDEGVMVPAAATDGGAQADVPEIIEVSSPVCYAGEFEPAVPAPVAPPVEAEAAAADAGVISGAGQDGVGAIFIADSSSSADATPQSPSAPPAAAGAPASGASELPPGHFRATPEMMSYVGCSEAEMAAILRDLGYRVHQPAAPDGAHSFSMRPRHQRPYRGRGEENRPDRRGEDRRGEDRRGEDRRGEGRHGPRRGRHGGRAPEAAASAAETPAPGVQEPGAQGPGAQEPGTGGPRPERHAGDGDERRAKHNRPGKKHGGKPPRGDRREQGGNEREDRHFEGRRGQRDEGRRNAASRPERTISSGPAAESPFAKLKELGLFK